MRLRLTPSGLTMDRVRSSAISGILSGTGLGTKPDSLPSVSPPRQKGRPAPVHREALPATAFSLHIGVAETERLIEALLDEIHDGAVDQGQACRIDTNLHPAILEDDVADLDLVGIVHHVREAGAAGLAYPEPQPDAAPAGGHEGPDTVGGGFGQ